MCHDWMVVVLLSYSHKLARVCSWSLTWQVRMGIAVMQLEWLVGIKEAIGSIVKVAEQWPDENLESGKEP